METLRRRRMTIIYSGEIGAGRSIVSEAAKVGVPFLPRVKIAPTSLQAAGIQCFGSRSIPDQHVVVDPATDCHLEAIGTQRSRSGSRPGMMIRSPTCSPLSRS